MASALLHAQQSTKTKKKMHTTFRALQEHAKEKSYGRITPSSVTAKQLRNYITGRLATVSIRTVENEATHLRHALRGAGRVDLAEQLTRADLKIPKATRIGSRKATDPVVLAAAYQRATADERIWIDLQRYGGMRQDEMIQSHKSVTLMLADLERGASHVTIRDGTKGGKIRDTYIPHDYREPLRDALQRTQAILTGRKYLIDAKNGDAAARQVHRHYKKLGLEGGNSSHSLRASFAVHSYGSYLSQELTARVALANLANDMGHGDGRGRWVYNNYLRGTLEG
ncbi:integrase domain-containing protein [Burkholderia sp. Bp8986]|uniref:integrase domain-containing protein n=1 Tax=Burkholderia sp. Bp8986 TaxID=2184550 RepID=UPI00163AF74A|nr:integrase domain-containing protein [Burkholderia sp. Bp8986]